MLLGKRVALACLLVLGLAVAVLTTLRPALVPLTQRTPLPTTARSSTAGVPVPASAERCLAPRTPGAERWCMPSGVSAATLQRWYQAELPPGRTAGGLRWCVEQRYGDGSRSALWSTGTGLVGYLLPPLPPRPPTQELDDPVAVEILAQPGATCSPVTRAGRSRA